MKPFKSAGWSSANTHTHWNLYSLTLWAHCRGNTVRQKQVIVSCVRIEGEKREQRSRHRERKREGNKRAIEKSQMRGNTASYWSLSATTTHQSKQIERGETKQVEILGFYITLCLWLRLLRLIVFDHRCCLSAFEFLQIKTFEINVTSKERNYSLTIPDVCESYRILYNLPMIHKSLQQ